MQPRIVQEISHSVVILNMQCLCGSTAEKPVDTAFWLVSTI